MHTTHALFVERYGTWVANRCACDILLFILHFTHAFSMAVTQYNHFFCIDPPYSQCSWYVSFEIRFPVPNYWLFSARFFLFFKQAPNAEKCRMYIKTWKICRRPMSHLFLVLSKSFTLPLFRLDFLHQELVPCLHKYSYHMCSQW